MAGVGTYKKLLELAFASERGWWWVDLRGLGWLQVLVSSFEWFWMILGGDGWYYEAVSGHFGWFRWWHWVGVPQGHFGSFCGGEWIRVVSSMGRFRWWCGFECVYKLVGIEVMSLSFM
jgi:hypothetical protein